ncbi:hypothetical protein CRG98_001934 [Punica granatum]|uniref:Uncharacterized protein n=1 Tax=Punica granatum TaxID=22663 RepID=A0A2I0LAJ0_PUNGR|nr:hypothetical protein CRG98_001934 [Punica granatum]
MGVHLTAGVNPCILLAWCNVLPKLSLFSLSLHNSKWVTATLQQAITEPKSQTFLSEGLVITLWKWSKHDCPSSGAGLRQTTIIPQHQSRFPAAQQGYVPFGYVPTTFQHRGSSPSGTSRLLFCTGVRPLRKRPDYFFLHHANRRANNPAPCKPAYVPTTFLHRGPSPSGVRPLRKRPDYFFLHHANRRANNPAPCKPAGQTTPHLTNPPGKTPRTPQVHWVGTFEPCSFGMRPVHIANPLGTSRLLFSTGVRPLRHRGPSPSGTSRLLFCSGVRPLRGSVPFRYVPTTFSCTKQTAGQNTPHLANPSDNTPRTPQVHWVGAFEPCCSFGMRPVHIANPSGTSRLLFSTGVQTLRVRPDYFSAQGSVPFGYVPTTFLLMGPSPSGTSRLLFPALCKPSGKTPRTLLTRRATRPVPRKSIG